MIGSLVQAVLRKVLPLSSTNVILVFRALQPYRYAQNQSDTCCCLGGLNSKQLKTFVPWDVCPWMSKWSQDPQPGAEPHNAFNLALTIGLYYIWGCWETATAVAQENHVSKTSSIGSKEQLTFAVKGQHHCKGEDCPSAKLYCRVQDSVAVSFAKIPADNA